uniref:Uncharacterized protein n=1 Tax=Nelumbo nucifera TaxID=4432 RepID=A0A822ZG70_NELNU|nr:TPA_asm: hypothetical protein HUJ06_001813 [Nelumbo nucifera]
MKISYDDKQLCDDSEQLHELRKSEEFHHPSKKQKLITSFTSSSAS